MSDEKALFYQIIKTLHYQNQLTYYLFCNNVRSTNHQKKEIFSRIAEIFSIFLAVLNFIIVNVDLIAGIWSFFISVPAALVLFYVLYHYLVNKEVEKEEFIMNLNQALMNIQYTIEQAKILSQFRDSDEISKQFPIQDKFHSLETYINSDLGDVWKNGEFKAKAKKKIEEMLKNMSFSFIQFKSRLESFKSDIEKVDPEYKKKSYYTNLCEYIKELN